MPSTPHVEKHFTASESVRDVVIGMADGLTVPFALAAGLSAAVSSSAVIVTAGLAEIAAGAIAMGLGGYLAARGDGAIAMGLGGYLAARGDASHYAAEEARERYEIEHLRDREVSEVRDIFSGYGLSGDTLDEVVDSLTSDKTRWTEFMMRFELGLDKPDPKRAPISAATIAVAYLVGGLVPLAPYMFAPSIDAAFRWSVVATGFALLIFGAVKGHFAGLNRFVSAAQTLLVGGLAAAAAYWLAHLIA
jgi:vacuolar iron transporter family protein